MNQWFGLGIALELRDGLSRGLESARNSFERFRQSTSQGVSDIEARLDALNKANLSGMFLQQNGDMIQGLGKRMINPIVDLGKNVVKTSSQFEDWRSTLTALYKDADVAKEKLNWGMKLAAETPFEVGDVTQALIGFKAVGADADKTFTDANGKAKSFLEYMGDLASLRPDVGLQGVLMGVRNLLGGDGGKSLKMRLDIDPEQILGRDFSSDTEGIMKDLVEFSDKLANGLMGKLKGNWTQIISNLEDQTKRLFLAIGDGGAFDTIKQSLQTFSDMINNIDDERMAKIGKNIAEAFKMIWTPINAVVKVLTKAFAWIIKLAETDSMFSKLVLGVVTFSGSILFLTGLMFKLGGGFIMTTTSLGTFLLLLQNSSIKFTSILLSIKLLSLKMLGLIGVVGALALAWKTDFMGIKSILTGFTNNVQSAWSEASRISKLNSSDMIGELDKVDKHSFGGWLTYRLTQLMVLWKAVCEAWNTNELSDETFQKVQELGLLPLLSTILDFKQRITSFFDGFIKGWQKVSEFIHWVANSIGKAIGKIIELIFPVKDAVDDVSTSVGGINIGAWEKFGEVTAYIVSILGGLWAFSKIGGIISTIIGLGMKFFSIISSIGSAVSFVISILSSVASSIGYILGLLGTVLGVIGTIVTTVLGFFGIVVTAPAWIVGAIAVALATIVALVIANWDTIVSYANSCWEAIVQGWNNFCAWISSGIQSIQAWWSNLVTTLQTFWDNMWSTIHIAVTTAMDVVYAKVTEAVNQIKSIWDGLKQTFSNVFSHLQSIASSTLGWLSSKFEGIANVVSNITSAIGNIGSGVGSFISDPIGSVKKMVGLNTGGYVKTTGVAMLHPNEVVVNDELTQKLRNFLDGGERGVTIPTSSSKGNSTSNTSNVNFNEGAIQINLQNGTEADATRLAKMVMEKIKRETQLRSSLNYSAI